MKRHNKNNNSDKVDLHVKISRDVYELLLEIAPSIYGEGVYRGALSYVVEEALRAYLSQRAHTHKLQNPKSKVKQVYTQVKQCISFRYHGGMYVPDQAPAKQVESCIAEVRGGDPRTVRRWLQQFLDQGLIKDLTPQNPPRRKIYELL